ncbi:type II secretion system F family protein [Castellaniella sp.]|uniref:type II secretion system F family protein n=1 Tax=Castellaniella sp. TaxID=1955812 RepID=UPI0035607FB3
MNRIDAITLIIFVSVILVGLSVLVFMDMWRKRPSNLLRQRLHSVSGRGGSESRERLLQNLQRAQIEARRRKRREAMGGLGYHLNRLDTVAGSKGVRILGLLMLGLVALGLLLLATGILPRVLWVALLAVLVVPLLVGAWLYRWLINRFSRRFLNQMADAMGMIVRASQAGIPVTQSIHNVGLQFEAPLGAEFLRMGNSLLLGEDLEDVLDKAVRRIELPDFTFFSVCVLLQRESGGSIAEALENLSAIIRARRDLQLKARALTAEGRLSGQMLSAIPFVIAGLLYASNPQYIEMLFITDGGRKLLWVAGGMLLVGILSIRHIANLRV